MLRTPLTCSPSKSPKELQEYPKDSIILLNFLLEHLLALAILLYHAFIVPLKSLGV